MKTFAERANECKTLEEVLALYCQYCGTDLPRDPDVLTDCTVCAPTRALHRAMDTLREIVKPEGTALQKQQLAATWLTAHGLDLTVLP